MRLTEFSSNTVIQPPDLYYLTYPSLIADITHTYFSGPITGGGAIRLKEQFPSLTTPDIIVKNRGFVLNLLSLLTSQGTIHGPATLPHIIGSRYIKSENNNEHHWSEGEYLVFWSMVIMRMNPELASHFYQNVTHNTEINYSCLTDYAAQRTKRGIEYQKLQQAITKFANTFHAEIDPVSSVIVLPDSQISLGSTLEQNIAQELGIPIQDIVFNLNNHSLKSSSLFRDAVFQILLHEDILLLTEESGPVSLQKRK
ncbi:MAG TPA: hypothetical protein VF209_00480 [Patescibacteria group bacterium]